MTKQEQIKEITDIINKDQYDYECTFGRDVWNGLLEKFGVEVEE